MPPMMGNRRMMRGPKEKTDFKSLSKIFKYAKKYSPLIIISLIFAVGGAVCTIIGPDRINTLVNLITDALKTFQKIDINEFTRQSIILISIYVVGAILMYVQQFIMATVTQKVTYKLRLDINKKIHHLPLNYFDTQLKGDILSIVTNDVDIIGQTLSMSTANLISSFAIFIGTFVMMFKSSWVLALITIGSSIFGFIMMAFILVKSQKYFNRKQDDLGAMNGHVEETITNYKIVNLFGGYKKEKIKFDGIADKLYEDNWKSQVLSGMNMHFMMFASNLSYALVFAVGLTLMIKGNPLITYGTIASFIIYARLFSQPLSTFAQSMTSIQQASAASRRIFKMLNEKEQDKEFNKKRLKKVIGKVTFNNVHFGYLKDKEIIHGFSANIKPGQKVAIVGPTGAGKTTIVKLLMRFYELNKGDISIDGLSIKDMKRTNVHDLFNMILQDTWLFHGTIRENLVYNNRHITDKKIYKTLKVVGLKYFIETLPHGLDTILTDNLNLSEGQKQQLTIARAILKNAPLLILDEATSNVDTRTELIIQKAMDKLTIGRTSFIIAHRLSTIKNADVIFVLNKGDIVESGNHNKLLKKKGFYADLYNSQFVEA